MFPVGNIARTGVSAPIVKNGVITDILDPFKSKSFYYQSTNPRFEISIGSLETVATPVCTRCCIHSSRFILR